jgi:hypothetical protein
MAVEKSRAKKATKHAAAERNAEPELIGKTPELEASTGFSLAQFALPQDLASMANVERMITTVPLRKPGRQQFVCMHPDTANWSASVPLINLKEKNEFYLVGNHLTKELADEWNPYWLVTYALRGGGVCLWPIRLPGRDGKDNAWWLSARQIVKEVAGKWVRIQADQEAGHYQVDVARGEIPAPEWPDMTFGRLSEICFVNEQRMISDVNHAVVRQLRGLE